MSIHTYQTNQVSFAQPNSILVLILSLLALTSSANDVGMPPVPMGEVAASILSGGGPNVSGFLTDITPENSNSSGREFEFKVNGSGVPVKNDSPDQDFIVRIKVYYYTDGTWAASLSVTKISTGEILNAGDSGALYLGGRPKPGGEPDKPRPLPKSAHDAIKQAFERLNRGRRDGRVLLRMPGLSSEQR